ncbi:class A beta-lactamase [Phenylobacterium sp. VNQ135]|uniref:class A beta-lactamase n=1 Tax=Phenylobacterium sp. VNQ135 TaxID=3400922 RepID=UPI003C002BA6
MSGRAAKVLPRRAVLAGGAAVVLGAAAPAAPFAALERRLEGGRLGVFARSGRATLAHRADERFPMCSTFKALLAACVLARVDAGEERLDRMIAYGPGDMLSHAPVTEAHLKDGALSVEALCKAIVEVSDNPAANLLLRTIGGPAGLTAWLRSIGDETTRLDRFELELNEALPGDPRDTTTPRAMAADYGRLFDGKVLTQASRRRLESWLVGATTGLQRLRKDTPAGWRVGDKTGNGARGSSNDVAVFWPPRGPRIYVAAYITGTSVPMDVRNAVHAEVGRIVREGLS